MQWLNAWLKSIIIIILFAAFVDLLLPSSKMQRYVKTVLSLFILLMLLSPVLELFRGNWNLDRLIAEAERKQIELPIRQQMSGQGEPSLQQIQEQADGLKLIQEQQAIILAEEQLAESMKTSIELETSYAVRSIHVLTAADAKGSRYIQQVNATIGERLEAGTQSSEDSRRKFDPIRPVQPVQIQIRLDDQQDLPADGSLGKSGSAKENHMKDQVRDIIQRHWGVAHDRIDLAIEAGI